MLICPQCQFENPNNHKFCQKCGTSLTYKICQECGSKVPFFQENCQNCAATTGTIWWAVISKNLNTEIIAPKIHVATPEVAQPSEANLPQQEATTVETENLSVEINTGLDKLSIQSTTEINSSEVKPELLETANTISTEISEADANSFQENITSDVTDNLQVEPIYLDAQNRYRIVDPQLILNSTNDSQLIYPVCTRVLDCQPFQTSVLQAILEQQKSNSANSINGEKTITIPAIAQVYITLQNQLNPALPKIHEAWQQGGQEVILLEDRSDWDRLEQLWNNDQVPLFKILYWLSEIVKLWAALEPYNCRQTLLELTNLCVDEDQTMCLQQLYTDPQDTNLTLQNLGQAWESLLQQSQRTQFKSLEDLLRDLRTGTIQTVEQLRSRLEAIALELEPGTQPAGETANSPSLQDFIAARQNLSMPTSQPVGLTDKSTEASEGEDLPTIVLPMQLLSLEEAGYTDIGRQRNHNEDFFGIESQIKKQETPPGRTLQARGLYILCDGMGGHASGEVASTMAVDTLRRYFQANWQEQLPDESTIREAVRLANMEIYNINQQNARSGSGRMGTTLVMVLIQDTNVAIAHVGDSRLYRISRRRGLEQLTIDHEVGQREIQRGVEASIAYSRPDAYQLTQALGPRDEHLVNPDIQFLELNEDTLLLLCSDGLSDNELLENHWQTHLLPLLSSRANLEQGVQQLIDLANQHNGHDNITAVLIRAKVRPNLEQAQLL